MKWPLREQNPELPDNFNLAFFRLKDLIRRLQNDPDLFEKYDAYFQDYLEKDIIEKAPLEKGPLIYYQPHHAVLTPHKTTTNYALFMTLPQNIKKE